MANPDVTICIPAWQSEPFIARTLQCARNQTYENIRILISIDQSSDRTEAICREAARRDPRIEVIAQRERFGWARNANFLLDNVKTEYFFIYFHDDTIEPTYAEALRDKLIASPGAVCAYCDMARVGAGDPVGEAIDYVGSAFDRLARFFTVTAKGVILRGMIRSRLLEEGLRFAHTDVIGRWQVPSFTIRLIASGPCLRVPELLYCKRNRPDRMTATWGGKSVDDLIAGQRLSARLCLEIIDGVEATLEEKEILRFCFYVWMMNWTGIMARRFKLDAPIVPETISPAFAGMRWPPTLDGLDVDFKDRLWSAYEELMRQQGAPAPRR